MPTPYERAHYRIPYPEYEGPRLVVGHQVCEVVDCSERGLRFRSEAHLLPAPGQMVEGRLRFPRGIEVRVEGMVMRVQDGEVALRLIGPGIPFRVILQEQIFLRRVRE